MLNRNFGGVVASLVFAAMISGCASMGGPSPEEEVQGVLDTFHTGMIGGDLDAIMAMVSEDYSNSQGATKSALQGLLATASSQGIFTDMKVDMANAEMNIDGDTASVTPVIFNTAVGALTLSYELKKESGVWMFTSTELQQ